MFIDIILNIKLLNKNILFLFNIMSDKQQNNKPQQLKKDYEEYIKIKDEFDEFINIESDIYIVFKSSNKNKKPRIIKKSWLN